MMDSEKTDNRAFMEVESRLLSEDSSFSRKTLKECARNSTVRTFGWPIAVFLDNRQEYTPKNNEHGIFAEISIKEKALTGGSSYDYWAINTRGSFYLLKSIFEDERDPERLFFDTRIVRITEVLMYLRNLYSCLEIDSGQRIQIMVKHGNIQNRKLGCASPRRLMFDDYITYVEKVETTIEVSLDKIQTAVVEVTKKFTDPLFDAFEFELDDKILKEIVENYEVGKMV